MSLIVVTGVSCSGKSTLAEQLSRRLCWALIAKDTIKESLFDTLGVGDAAWSRRLSDAAYGILFAHAENCLRAGHSVIIEANFRRDEHSPIIEKLLSLTDGTKLQIHCRANPDELCARFRQRSRHPGHLDDVSVAAMDEYFATAEQVPLSLSAQLLDCDASGDWQRAISATIDRIMDLVEQSA